MIVLSQGSVGKVSASAQCIERRRIADLAIKHRAVTTDCAAAVSLRAVDSGSYRDRAVRPGIRGLGNIIEPCRGDLSRLSSHGANVTKAKSGNSCGLRSSIMS